MKDRGKFLGLRIPLLYRKISSAPETRELSRSSESPLHAATRLFIDASMQYPKSVIVQAAALSLACRDAGLDPLQLRDALLSDPDRLARITHFANVRHRNATPDHPTIVDVNKVTRIARCGFNWAEAMTVLTPDEMQWIFDRYHIIVSNSYNETVYREAVRNQIFGNGGKLSQDLYF